MSTKDIIGLPENHSREFEIEKVKHSLNHPFVQQEIRSSQGGFPKSVSELQNQLPSKGSGHSVWELTSL